MENRIVIDLHDVSEHEGSWTFPLTRDWSAAAFKDCDVAPAGEDGLLEVGVTPTGKDYLVQGRLRIGLAGTCVRCLRPTSLEINTPIAVLFVPGPVVVREPAKDDGAEAEPDEGPDVEHYQGHRLILDEYVRDTILLEVPMNPRCAVDCTLPGRPQGES
ncbi:MAG: DUF177 domain-containing protein [Deltaproteobacteria bacterium]|nr:DUF177 domain-containing protein [Deltaproteobacteria bacterium]